MEMLLNHNSNKVIELLIVSLFSIQISSVFVLGSTTWSMLKSFVLRALFIYFVTSMFRRQPPQKPQSVDGIPSIGENLYPNGTYMVRL